MLPDSSEMRKRSSSMPRRTRLSSGSVVIMAWTQALVPSLRRGDGQDAAAVLVGAGKYSSRSPKVCTPSLASAFALASPMPLR